jgi:hypothetical protein
VNERFIYNLIKIFRNKDSFIPMSNQKNVSTQTEIKPQSEEAHVAPIMVDKHVQTLMSSDLIGEYPNWMIH